MIQIALLSLFLATPMVSVEPSPSLSPTDLLTVSEEAGEEFREAVARCREGKYAESIPVFRRLSDQGDVGATYILAKLYAGGQGTAPDPKQAAALFEANVRADHAPSMIALGELKEADSPALAVQLYRQASGLDELLAHLKLGDIYERGILGVRANPKRAFFYFDKMARADLPAGTFRLARCYDTGIGISPDALQATKLYRKAALGGHVPAQVTMARRYFEGKGLDPDPIAAVGWLTLASQSGSSEARVLLGLRYENGDAVMKDLNLAGQLYSAAAKQGDPTGRFHLAHLYADGIGTPADPVRAYVLLTGAQALPAAQEALAKLESTLTPEQLSLAKKKVAEQRNEEDLPQAAPTTRTPESALP